MKPEDIFEIARAVAPCVKGHHRCVAGHAIDIHVLGMVEDTIRIATRRERSRCAALAQTVGDDDAEPHSAREVAYRIAAAIEGGS